MWQLTVPDDAAVDGDDVWWVVDGIEVHNDSVGLYGTPEVGPPDDLVALTEPCANAWCNRGHDMRYDEGHSRRCADCVDGKPLVQLVQHCQRRCIGKPRRHGDRVTAKLCDCEDGMVSLGVGTVEIKRAVSTDETEASTEDACLAQRSGVAWGGGNVVTFLDLDARPGQFVVHWKRAG